VFEREYDAISAKIYAAPNRHLHSFCLSLYIKAGCLFETDEENGISHLFEHVVFRNLKEKYDDFYGLIAKHGIEFYGSTYKEFIRFTVTGPMGEFALASEILCGVFDEIKIPGSEFVKEKKRIKAEKRENDYRSSLDCFFDQAVWKGTELEKWSLETCRELDRMSQKRVNAFREKCFTRDNFFFCVTGNVTSDDLDILIGKLSDLPLPEGSVKNRNAVSLSPDFFHRDFSVSIKNNYWHYVKIGFDIDCSRYRNGVLDLLYDVLFKTEKALIHGCLSEENPLIYSYDSTLEQYDNVGNLHFSFEVDQKNLKDSLALVVKTLMEVKDGKFDFDAYLKAELYHYLSELDQPDSLNWSIAYYNRILDCMPLDYDDVFCGRFNVTKEMVTEAARDIFRGCNMTVAIKGNARKLDRESIRSILYPLGE